MLSPFSLASVGGFLLGVLVISKVVSAWMYILANSCDILILSTFSPCIAAMLSQLASWWFLCSLSEGTTPNSDW